VDESEIDSANETATFGWPFHFPGTFAGKCTRDINLRS
jgi:hypothetical protein